jgi:hypothetical protein
MPRSRGRLTALALTLAASAAPAAAEAYCITTSCNDAPGQTCTPSRPGDCGISVKWMRACIGFSVQEDASAQVSLPTVEALMTEAFAAWTDAACADGGSPSISAHNLGPVACDRQEYNRQGGNANVVIFRDEAWPYAGQANTLALTTVTYDLDTGEIYDADLEVNSTPAVALTVGDGDVQYDLPSILTHEVGHMLGIAHSPVAGATMAVEYIPGDTGLRTLHPDDVAAICSVYPPDENRGTCDPTPRHGFRDTCGQPAEDGGDCSCRLGPSRGGAVYLALGGALVWLARRRRRG